MAKTLQLLFLIILCIPSFGQDCNSYGNTQIDSDINNINARLLNSGDLWRDEKWNVSHFCFR